jgi:hypothetical protein
MARIGWSLVYQVRMNVTLEAANHTQAIVRTQALGLLRA